LKYFDMMVRSLLAYFLVGLLGAVCAFPCLVVAALPERLRLNNRVYLWFAGLFYRGVVFATMLRVTVVGRQHLEQECAIVVANHQSALDIPFVGALLGTHPHVWLVLEHYARVPIFGFLIRRMAIVVDQSNVASRSHSMLKTLRYANNCQGHIIIFPEGGRYLEGRPQRFMNGFALLAHKTGLPVIPVYLKNLNDVYPPYSFFIRAKPIKVIVGEPVTPSDEETAAQFGQRVYDWYLTHIEQEKSHDAVID